MQVATDLELEGVEMGFIRRYRMITMKRALKAWTPLFSLDAEDVTAILTGGRL